ncbi:ABC-2 type transport system ATP-binding protein [Virgibacillus natechei]|uniref:ABC-2 type transport system ATP-binding protein n=1 Tax=Virgibacillus natechei TaxID=1216297 RepID=A0ABS4IKK7_9BACI|nr:ABC transporter ATP-binding protein [Virgibacillus natechei]MBP1970976.1 ABC-2 type transport system ATP-binding protein [Virgibacillus natechei]UZD12744.1 ABC transporter ATP-binding protein [Virgibacillus natechei]
MDSFVEINELQKQIDDFHLGPINVTVEPGTITALVGNNGSGKSSLLKLMMNLAKPDTGNTTIFGKKVSSENESWKSHVSYQPQTVIGWNAYTGKTLKNLISALYPNWDEVAFNHMVDLFDIPLNKQFGKLSQGVQQKLSLALTIPRNTPLLLLDEPTSFMDIPSKKHLTDILVDWMDQGDRAIIMASHQSADMMKLADYLSVIRSGEWIGNFEKEALTETFKRYWVSNSLPAAHIPGEVSRGDQQIISNQPEATENYFLENNLEWANRTALDLEDIITLLLQRKHGDGSFAS